MLELLGQSIRERGCDPSQDRKILTRIYDEHDPEHRYRELFEEYTIWSKNSNRAPEPIPRSGYLTPEARQEKFLKKLDNEIDRLKRGKTQRASIASMRQRWDTLRQGVPNTPVLDRLLRYQVTLERSIDRTLNQLERLQRMRRGQPGPPEIKVNVST